MTASADPYAEAMTLHAPLGRVAGVASPAPLAQTPADGTFDAAVAYAQQASSYSLLIWQGGKLRVERYFEPHDRDLRPESASMAKSVLALAVAAALADGAIHSVDDPVGRYIPEWKDDARGAITVRNLLNMASGLAPLSYVGGAAAPAVMFQNDGAKARSMTLDLKPATAPGTTFSYANAVSQVLVLVLERATGKPYGRYLSERIWTPIGNGDAYLWNNEPDGFPRGYSALMATARDWLRVGLLIKDRGQGPFGRVLPADLVDAMTAPSATNPNYGWQVWRGGVWTPKRFYNDAKTGASVAASAPFAVDDMVYFDGFGGQRVYISRSKDLVIVRLGTMQVDWDDAILPNLVIKQIP